MRTKHAFVMALVAAGLIAIVAGSAAAHHSFAAFDSNAQKSIAGTIRKVEWTNPHIWIWMDVPNSKSGVDLYSFEGMSPNYLNRRGWNKDTLKPGDKVTISFRPFKDPANNGGMFMSTRLADGKTLTMGGANE